METAVAIKQKCYKGLSDILIGFPHGVLYIHSNTFESSDVIADLRPSFPWEEIGSDRIGSVRWSLLQIMCYKVLEVLGVRSQAFIVLV